MGGILAVLALSGAGAASSQQVVGLQAGTLSGVIRDAETGQPVGYSLVLIPERQLRTFSSTAGRFAVPSLSPGGYTLQVRQIGYAPATLTIRLVEEGNASAQPLVIHLTRQALVLPEVSVTAGACRDPSREVVSAAARAILDQVITNGERLLAMEREYPLRARFERLSATLNAADSVLAYRWDTLGTTSDRIQGYRRGRVLEQERGRPVSVHYFTTSDIARKEFREHHCLWVVGEETVDGARLVRIDFAPAERVRTADWAGALFLDATTGLLRRSEATLMRIPREAGGLASARCEVTYREIVPTLVHEEIADCHSGLTGGDGLRKREVWRLLTWEFTGWRPGGA